MNISTLRTSMGRRLAISGLAFALAFALGGAIWLTSSTSPASATVSQTANSLGGALNADGAKPSPATTAERAKLKADLKAARALTGPARAAALKKIRKDAKTGAYGAAIGKHLGMKADRRAAFIALLPDSLQAELKKLKATPPGDAHKALRAQISKDALDGKYGAKVQKAVELLRRK